MYAGEIISDAIPPLRTSDTVQKVFERMAEFKVDHLPIVNETQFLGLIAEEDLIEEKDFQAEIGGLSISLVNPFVYNDQHIFDVIRLFYEQRLSVVPVLDKKKNYLGIISINNLTEYLATLFSVSEPGAIIVLEINSRNNSLAQMAQIVESNNAQVLSSYIRSFPDSTRLEITLKVNKTDISQIIASFTRYEYTVKATFNNQDIDNGTLDRYDQFMNYLNI